MKTQFLLLLAIILFSCQRASEKRDEKLLDDDTEQRVDVDNDGTVDVHVDTSEEARRMRNIDTDSPDVNAFAEFGLTNGDMTFKVRDWRSKMNLRGLGTPNDTLTRVLSLTSDTHQGSTITEYKYNDVNLEFFSPKGSNDAWLKTIEIKGGPWSTARGIKVGDSVNDLKSMYPRITQSADTKDPYMYSYSLEDSQLLFGVDADKVTRIKIMYNIN